MPDLLLFDEQPFLPTRISDLVLWHDASDTNTITESSGSVSAWADRSGNSNNATQGVGANQPTTGTRTINSKNALDFDHSVGDFMISGISNTTFGTTASFTGFVVFKWDGDATSSNTFLASTISSTNRFVATINTNSELIIATYDGSYNSKTVPFSDTSNAYLLTFKHTSADVITAFLDNIEMTGTTETPATSTTQRVTIGARTFGDSNLDGLIAEIIVYDRVLSTTETTLVENYLSNKWGTFRQPTDVSGCQLWLDASDTNTITESSGSVSQWNDKSGNGNNVTQDTGSEQPTTNASTQNSRNVITFDGGDSLVIPSALYTIPQDDNTIFVVSKRTSEDASLDTIVGMGQAGVNNGYFLLYNSTSGEVLFRNRQAAGTVTSTGNTNTDFQVLRGRRNGTTQAVAVNSGAEVTAATATDPTTINIGYIGNSASASLFLNGEVAEVLIYNRSLTSTEITNIENYLSNKWGI